MEHVKETGYKDIWQRFVNVSMGLSALAVISIPAGLYLIYRTSQAARDAALETRRAAQATLFSDLLSEYASEPLHTAMRELFRWKEDYPDDFEKRFVELYLSRNPRGDELDGCRRITFQFFNKLQLLKQRGLVDSEFIDLTFVNVGGPFLLDVLEPLLKAHGEAVTRAPYPMDLFDYYRRKYQASRSGLSLQQRSTFPE